MRATHRSARAGEAATRYCVAKARSTLVHEDVRTLERRKGRARRQARHLRTLLLVGLAAISLVACGTASADHPPRAGGDGGGGPLNWDRPIVEGIALTSPDQAMPYLKFRPVVPKALPAPAKLWVSPSYNVIAWVYQDAVMGRFLLIESQSLLTQARLEALATCDPKKGCEGEWSLKTIRSGITALFISGDKTTGLMWVENGVTFDVYGPSPAFTPDMAIKVANGI